MLYKEREPYDHGNMLLPIYGRTLLLIAYAILAVICTAISYDGIQNFTTMTHNIYYHMTPCASQKLRAFTQNGDAIFYEKSEVI